MARKLIVLALIPVFAMWVGCRSAQRQAQQSRGATGPKIVDAAVVNAPDQVPPAILPETYFAAAQLFEHQGQPGRAIEQYRKAVAVNHDYVDAYYRLGILLSQAGQHEEALAALWRAVELRPYHALLRNDLGFEFATLNRTQEAERELRQAMQLKPNYARAQVNLGMVLCQQERFAEALDAFCLALPEEDAHYNLGIFLRGQQRYDEAANAFAQALNLNSTFTAAQQQLQQIAPRLKTQDDSAFFAQTFAGAQAPAKQTRIVRSTRTTTGSTGKFTEPATCAEALEIALTQRQGQTGAPTFDPTGSRSEAELLKAVVAMIEQTSARQETARPYLAGTRQQRFTSKPQRRQLTRLQQAEQATRLDPKTVDFLQSHMTGQTERKPAQFAQKSTKKHMSMPQAWDVRNQGVRGRRLLPQLASTRVQDQPRRPQYAHGRSFKSTPRQTATPRDWDVRNQGSRGQRLLPQLASTRTQGQPQRQQYAHRGSFKSTPRKTGTPRAWDVRNQGSRGQRLLPQLASTRTQGQSQRQQYAHGGSFKSTPRKTGTPRDWDVRNQGGSSRRLLPLLSSTRVKTPKQQYQQRSRQIKQTPTQAKSPRSWDTRNQGKRSSHLQSPVSTKSFQKTKQQQQRAQGSTFKTTTRMTGTPRDWDVRNRGGSGRRLLPQLAATHYEGRDLRQQYAQEHGLTSTTHPKSHGYARTPGFKPGARTFGSKSPLDWDVRNQGSRSRRLLPLLASTSYQNRERQLAFKGHKPSSGKTQSPQMWDTRNQGGKSRRLLPLLSSTRVRAQHHKGQATKQHGSSSTNAREQRDRKTDR